MEPWALHPALGAAQVAPHHLPSAYLADRRDLPAVKAAGEPMWLIVLGPMVAMVGLALLLLGWQQ